MAHEPRRTRAAEALMLQKGDLYAGRFRLDEAEDEPAEAAGERYSGRIASNEIDEEPDLPIGLPGVDTHTGARVRIILRSDDRSSWEGDLSREAVARAVMEMRLPWTATVLHAGPGVVFAEIPPRKTVALTLGEAAECAIQICDVVARLHAVGWAIADFPPRSLRIIDEGGRRRILWIVPAPWLRLPPESVEHGRDAAEKLAGISTNIVRIVDLFFSLHAPMSAADRAALDPDRAAALDRLLGVRRRAPGVALPPDVASLGGELLKLLDAQAEWRERIAAMPRVPPLPRVLVDWDRIIALGEEHLAAERATSNAPTIELPLAAAYYQRASRAFSQSDAPAALRDAERAVEIDPSNMRYRWALVASLKKLGRDAEARGHAEQILKREPDVAAHRARFTKLFD